MTNDDVKPNRKVAIRERRQRKKKHATWPDPIGDEAANRAGGDIADIERGHEHAENGDRNAERFAGEQVGVGPGETIEERHQKGRERDGKHHPAIGLSGKRLCPHRCGIYRGVR